MAVVLRVAVFGNVCDCMLPRGAHLGSLVILPKGGAIMKAFAIIFSMVTCVGLLAGCAAKHESSTGGGYEQGDLFLLQGQGVCQEVKTGKMWQVDKAGPFESLADARAYAANLTLAEYSDWRIPTKDELLNLFQACFWKRSGDCVMNQRGEYWAISEDDSSLGHWGYDLVCGPEFEYVKAIGGEGYVRAIRP